MPRGNFETVAPRALVLPRCWTPWTPRRYADAHALASRHRIDLNLLVDWAWPRFLEEADAFVADVDDPEALMELVESLDERDATGPEGIYEHACAERRRKTARITREKASREGEADDANRDGDVLRTPAMRKRVRGRRESVRVGGGRRRRLQSGGVFDRRREASGRRRRTRARRDVRRRARRGRRSTRRRSARRRSTRRRRRRRFARRIEGEPLRRGDSRGGGGRRRAPAPKPVDDSDAALDGDLTPSVRDRRRGYLLLPLRRRLERACLRPDVAPVRVA